MAKGGSRARSGPAPDPEALRRERDADEWETLPAKGRPGRAPAWPLGKATALERRFWTREWKRPQAIVWERNGQELEVALYVRALADSLQPGAPVTLLRLVRQHQEDLGISLTGLARHRWRIEEAAPKNGRSRRSSRATPRSSRERFQVLSGGRA